MRLRTAKPCLPCDPSVSPRIPTTDRARRRGHHDPDRAPESCSAANPPVCGRCDPGRGRVISLGGFATPRAQSRADHGSQALVRCRRSGPDSRRACFGRATAWCAAECHHVGFASGSTKVESTRMNATGLRVSSSSSLARSATGHRFALHTGAPAVIAGIFLGFLRPAQDRRRDGRHIGRQNPLNASGPGLDR